MSPRMPTESILQNLVMLDYVAVVDFRGDFHPTGNILLMQFDGRDTADRYAASADRRPGRTPGILKWTLMV